MPACSLTNSQGLEQYGCTVGAQCVEGMPARGLRQPLKWLKISFRDLFSPTVLVCSAAITMPRLGGLSNSPLFLSIREAGSPRSGYQQGRDLVGALSQAGRQSPSCCVLVWQGERASKLSDVSVCKDTNATMLTLPS